MSHIPPKLTPHARVIYLTDPGMTLPTGLRASIPKSHTLPLRILSPSGDPLINRHECLLIISRMLAYVTARPTFTYFLARSRHAPQLALAKLFDPRLHRRSHLPYNLVIPPDWHAYIEKQSLSRALTPPAAPAISKRKKAYLTYLQTDHWAALRRDAIKRWGPRCINCANEDEIQVHHLRYRQPLTLCTTDDVLPLCCECHDGLHEVIERCPKEARAVTDSHDPKEAIKALRDILRRAYVRPRLRSPVALNTTVLTPSPPRPRWRSP